MRPLAASSALLTAALLASSCTRAIRPVALQAPPQHAEPRSDSWREAAEFFRSKRWTGDGEIPVERYIEAQQQARLMRRYSLASGAISEPGSPLERPAGASQREATFGSWQSLGPGNIGGRVRGLAIDPRDPSTIYAGTATGGVFKTRDGGKTWVPLTDFLPVLSIGALAMSPVDPNTLYLGTGEASRGAGIFKTTDAGQTWNQLKATASFFYTQKIVISPKRPSNIYAATDSGVWTSRDAGATWARSFPSTGSYYCIGLAIRAEAATDTVFASCQMNFSPDRSYAVYRNTDAGGTGAWERVLSDPKMDAVALAVAPSQPSTVYALAVDGDFSSPYSGALLAFYRSTAGGDNGTWEIRTSNASPDTVNPNILSYPSCPYQNNDHHGQGSYNLDVAVDPTNPNRVFAAGIDLFRSDDGGMNWGYLDGGSRNYAHSDQHILAFDPKYDGQGNQTLYAGNDGGVFRTDAAAGAPATGTRAFCFPSSSAAGWLGLNNGFTATQFYHGAVYPGGGAYFGGTQDNGTPRGAETGGPNRWTSLYGGDGGDVAVDPVDANTLFYEYIYLSLRKSTDGGVNSADSFQGITEDPKDFPFINYFAVDPADSLHMYTGGKILWRTLNGAANWTAASTSLSDSPSDRRQVTTITVSPADPNTVYAGTNDGRVYRNTRALSANGTTVWAFSTPRSGYVSRIVVDPKRPTTVYAVYSSFSLGRLSGHIYRSSDGGLTWTLIDGSGASAFPDIPAHTLLIDPDDSSRLYVGTDIGVFVSLDGGTSWMQDDNPFANVITESLLMDQNGSTKSIYAFTYGRGAWRVALNGAGNTCSYSVSVNSLDVPAGAAVIPVDVTTGPNCHWVALSDSTFAGFQSPASGTGSGRAFLTVKANSGRSRSDTVFVQNQRILVNQGASPSLALNDDLSTAQSIGSLPFGTFIFNGNHTQNPTDPQHSCTQSADFRTAWWKLTATSNSRVVVAANGRRTDVYGDSGVVLSAYPLSNTAPGSELACAKLGRSAGTNDSVSIQFDVAAGSSYAIEVSAPGNTADFIDFEAALLPKLSIAPSPVTLAAGVSRQFTASVTDSPNAAVRWTVLPPVGTITPAGNYTAPSSLEAATTVTITAQSFANPLAQATATVTIQPAAISFSAAGITNAAGFQSGPLAPGEVITIFGNRLGPDTLAGAQLDAQGRLSSNLAGTRVLFDGIAAPLIYVAAGQLSAIVPYEVAAAAQTRVQVERSGQLSAAVSVPVTDAAPALFTANASGSGPAAAQNQNGTPNSPATPAARGSVIVLYGTGEGQTNPPGVTGLIASAVFPKPALPVSVQIGGEDAEILYAGAVPGLVAGVLQINVKVPADLPAGLNPVIVKVGSNRSRGDVTVSVAR